MKRIILLSFLCIESLAFYAKEPEFKMINQTDAPVRYTFSLGQKPFEELGYKSGQNEVALSDVVIPDIYITLDAQDASQQVRTFGFKRGILQKSLGINMPTKMYVMIKKEKNGLTLVPVRGIKGNVTKSDLKMSVLKPKGAEALVDKESITPLMRAAQKGDISLMNKLLASGANVNAKDNKGFGPLAYAVKFRQHKAAELLMKHGAEDLGVYLSGIAIDAEDWEMADIIGRKAKI